MFQHTAARRRLPIRAVLTISEIGVSTHSRAKAAALQNLLKSNLVIVSTHSRAKAAAPYIKKQEKSAD